MAAWKEVSPGRFERQFDSIERFFFNLSHASQTINREHWSITIFALIEAKAPNMDVISALRHAWKTLRYDHPQLACHVHGNTKVYDVPDELALEVWLNKTFIIAPATATKQELLALFRPSGQATLTFLPSASEIMIHGSHWCIDFIGALNLLQNLLTAVVEPHEVQFGSEGQNLSPSRDVAANYKSSIDLDPPALAAEREKAGTDLVMHLFNNMPSIGLPAQNTNRTPGGTYRSEIVIEPGLTFKIVAASKERGFTVTTTMHAALITTLQRLNSNLPSSPDKYASWGVFDVRKRLAAPLDDPSIHPVAVHMIGLPLVIKSSTYMNLAHQLKQYYKQTLPPSADSQFQEGVLVSYTNQMADIVAQPPPPDSPASTEPMLSSMGIIDRHLKRQYGDIELKDFWVAVETTTPQTVFYLWTWQSKMTLSACYNETFYDKAIIDGVLEQVIETLVLELAI